MDAPTWAEFLKWPDAPRVVNPDPKPLTLIAHPQQAESLSQEFNKLGLMTCNHCQDTGLVHDSYFGITSMPCTYCNVSNIKSKPVMIKKDKCQHKNWRSFIIDGNYKIECDSCDYWWVGDDWDEVWESFNSGEPCEHMEDVTPTPSLKLTQYIGRGIRVIEEPSGRKFKEAL